MLAAMVHRTLSSTEAVRLGATNRVCPAVPVGCPTLGDFIVNLNGKTVQTAAGPVKLSTSKIVGDGGDRGRQPNQVIAFRKLDLIGQAIHTLTSPSIAYLLLVVGLSLIIFEFFTISVGLAGGAGALALIGAFVGFSHLPVTWWALLLILVGMVGYAIDVQAGRPLAWTVIGSVLLIVGLALPLRRLAEAQRPVVGARHHDRRGDRLHGRRDARRRPVPVLDADDRS